MKHLYLLLTFCLCATGWASAQQESTLSTMRSLPQHTYINPAFVPQQMVYVGLPVLSSTAGNASSNSLSYQKLKDAGLLDSLTSTGLLAIRPSLKKHNNIFLGVQTDLFGLGFRLNPKLYLRYRASMHIKQRTILPKDIAVLADEENYDQPQSVLLDPSLDAMVYLENSIGASYMVNPKLTVGANIKRINGLATVQTEKIELKITSDPNNKYLSAEGEMLAIVSGQKYLEDDVELDQQSIRNDISKNGGWAVDLGATYQLTPKLQLGLSVLDLGYIKWGNSVSEYRTERAVFTIDKIDENSSEEALIDSLEKYFVPKEKALSSFTTGLPMRSYLTATYEIHRNLMASGIFFSQFQEGQFIPGFTAALHKDFGRRLGTSISYTATNGSYSNLGAGLSLRLTPFQLYVVTDNLLSAIKTANTLMGSDNQNDAQNVSVRVGLNLVFGTIKKPTKLPY